MDGVVVIDKIRGITSHDVVAAVRKVTGSPRVGHFGTLDPLATGVLPVALGRATRLQQFYLGSRKVYRGTFRFGFSTSTYDAEGTPTSEVKSVSLTTGDLERVREQFLGPIQQTPPAFSAKKVRGISSHRLARRSQPVELKPIQVEVYKFELSLVSEEEADFEVECSAGTYIRSLAHEMGKSLHCGGHLTSLRRIASGEFTLKQAVDFSLLQNEGSRALAAKEWINHWIPLSRLLLWMPAISVRDSDLKRVKNGMPFTVELKVAGVTGVEDGWRPDRQWVRLLTGKEELVGIGLAAVSAIADDWMEVKPKVVLSTPLDFLQTS
jgi:tRNA pseudouridine55 synthase